jgi:hypothetical protein
MVKTLKLLAECDLMKEAYSRDFASFDAEIRFLLRATQGSSKEGLQLLNQLDQHFKERIYNEP